VHYAFGIVMGGFYGALAEIMPIATKGRGLAYGAGMWAIADEVVLPAAGFAKWWPSYPTQIHANALAAHLVYASVLDATRQGMLHLLNLRRSESEPATFEFRAPERQRERLRARTGSFSRRFSEQSTTEAA
jgi:uncharacterized membrane protein YagU involved in acid resistance